MHTQLCALWRCQTDPAKQQPPLVAATHMASAPQVEVPPQALPGGMRCSPVHESSAAEGWQVHLAELALMQVQPAGQQVPGYCPSRDRYGLLAPAARAAGDEVPPHWSQGLSSAPAGQLVGASQTVLFSLSLTTRLPSTTCSEAAGCEAHGAAEQSASARSIWRPEQQGCASMQGQAALLAHRHCALSATHSNSCM